MVYLLWLSGGMVYTIRLERIAPGIVSSSLTLATKLLQIVRDRGVWSSSPVSYAGDHRFESDSRLH